MNEMIDLAAGVGLAGALTDEIGGTRSRVVLTVSVASMIATLEGDKFESVLAQTQRSLDCLSRTFRSGRSAVPAPVDVVVVE